MGGMTEGLDTSFRGILAPAAPEREWPSELGDYRLLRKVGEGGMAQVFLAEHRDTLEKVALKVLHPRFAENRERVAQLRAEATVLSQLSHENVVKVFALHDAPPLPYLVMEFLDGVPLRRLMGRPMEPSLALALLIQVCRALEAVHRRGVLHRDLKPDNIFVLTRPGRPPLVKVIDFGLATPLAQAAKPADGAVGTARYMAPEQWQGRPLDARTDLYAVGVCAFGMATGRPPFTEEYEEELRGAHCFWQPPDPCAVHPGVPVAWGKAILKALAKEPSARFSSAAAFAGALEAALQALRFPAEAEGAEDAEDAEDALWPAEDADVDRALQRYRAVKDGDAYGLLGLSPDARVEDVWLSGARRLSELNALSKRPFLEEKHRQALERARRRVMKALCLLGPPHKRIGRDAAAGNLAGVARCITAMGAKATQALRAARPLSNEVARKARCYRKLGDVRARKGEGARALDAYEHALRMDPLDVALHRRYWALKREVLQGGSLDRPR